MRVHLRVHLDTMPAEALAPVAVLTIETATGGVLRASTGAALQIQSDAGPLAPSPFLAGVDVAADLDLIDE